MSEKIIEFYVPDVIFKTRVKNNETDSFEWKDVSSREMFKVFPGDEVVCKKIPGSKAKIKEVLKRYARDKEYRRVYYGNKYKTCEKYRLYVRDYNKERYENKKKIVNMDRGISEVECDKIRANGLFKYYSKTDREEVFKNKYKTVSELLD